MLHTLDLNGTWQVRWTDGQRGQMQHALLEEADPARYLDAQVPGEIHLDAMRAGWIQEPCEGLNVLAARWVEECIWSYRRVIEVPEGALQGRAWLHFEGLDLAAIVVLNGEEIGRHANSFYPCRIEVTGKLKPGRNLLVVHLEGGLFMAAERPVEGWGVGLDARLHKRHWLRKPQCQFSWDWAPRLINVGIHKPVWLEWTADAARADQFVPLAELSPDLRQGRVRGRLFVEGLGDTPVPGKLTLEIPEAGVSASADIEIQPGLHPYEVTAEVCDPLLWWPAGHGPQNLYTVHARLQIGGQVAAERPARIGFRRVRVNQDPHPEGGRAFVLEVNGRPIFCKGGNFVPADILYARIDRARYEGLIKLAREANFNLLRVWGGGLYESDDFYALCDEKGILVWQEFIFACGKYPLHDEAFFNSCKAEAIYNIRRLACHPSLVVWCGNNEMEWGAWEWGFDRGVVHPDYAFFHLTLPRLLAQEDGTRYYQPSSPYSPDGVAPNADHVGDQHPWSVGFANTDFRDYRTMACRFPNEGGILGPTALPTLLACLPEGQRQVHSFAWQIHDNSIALSGEPSPTDEMVRQWTGRDVRTLSVEEFVYWAGLVQGEGLREYCENFRRRMFSTASAIFWMYNDTWPATRSWTIVDYYLRRTPAFYPVRRALSPIHVVVAKEGEEIIIFGVNDTPTAWYGELRYGVFRLAGGLPKDVTMAVTLPANTSTPLARFEAAEWPDPSSSAAFAMLKDSKGELAARSRLFLPLFKDLEWAPARLRCRLEKDHAVFESDVFVWGVCLDLEGEELLPDNFFDVWPGIPYVLPWQEERELRVRFVGNLVGPGDLPSALKGGKAHPQEAGSTGVGSASTPPA